MSHPLSSALNDKVDRCDGSDAAVIRVRGIDQPHHIVKPSIHNLITAGISRTLEIRQTPIIVIVRNSTSNRDIAPSTAVRERDQAIPRGLHEYSACIGAGGESELSGAG